MVKNFQVITKAVRAKKDSFPADQLAYACEVLVQRQSGSAQLYAQGFAEASNRFQGQRAITPENAMTLVQTLMGSQGGQPAVQSQSVPGDIGSLLGGLLGGRNTPNSEQALSSQGGLDVNTLLTTGMAFFQARLQGAAPMEALV